jgi:hypothetical protein
VGTKIEELRVALTRVVVGPHVSKRSGRLVPVKGYTYNRQTIKQLGHQSGWDIIGEGSAWLDLPRGSAAVDATPTGASGTIRDANGKTLYHIEDNDAAEVFTRIEALIKAGRGVLGNKKQPRKPFFGKSTYRGTTFGGNREPQSLPGGGKRYR